MTMKHTIKFDISRWNKDWSSILGLSTATAVFVIVVVALLGLSRRRWQYRKGRRRGRVLRSAREGLLAHDWLVHDLFAKPTYCNVCDTVMVGGVQCSQCNLYADEKCLKRADKMFKCKQVFEAERVDNLEESSLQDAKLFKRTWHHCWVKGNLKLENRFVLFYVLFNSFSHLK